MPLKNRTSSPKKILVFFEMFFTYRKPVPDRLLPRLLIMMSFSPIDRALAWQQRAQKCLKNDDVANELKKLSSAANEVKESRKENTDESAEESTEDTDTDTENSATKLSAMKKLPDVKLSNKLLNLLEDLLLEGDLLETNMDECHQIWKLLQVKKFKFEKIEVT